MLFSTFLFSTVAMAQSAAGAAKPSIFEQLMPFVFIFVIFYFLLIRPQQKKQKAHADFLTKIKRGDSVLTSSGMLGTIEGLTDKFITLEIADGVNVRVLRSSIQASFEEETK